MDLDRIKVQADLLAICGKSTSLKKVAATGGGEWAGPCPFCPDHGTDRFRVQPNARPHGLWMCRHCTGGKWDSIIGFIARRENLDPRKQEDLHAICRLAGGGTPGSGLANPAHPSRAAYAAAGSDWQASARGVVDECQDALWQPKYAPAREYLYSRGLKDETIRHFRLGYCATGKPEVFGRTIAGLYVPRGLVIPAIVSGMAWYIKIRLLPGVPCRCQHCKIEMTGPGRCPGCGKDSRYLGVKGSRTAAIFNADALTRRSCIALFCEGEFDCMIAWQEFGDLVPVATMGGSASNHLDMAAWGIYLSQFKTLMVTYDEDQAGAAGAEWLFQNTSCARLAPLPKGVKDINEYHQKGGSLLEWITPYFDWYLDPFFLKY